MEVRICKHKKCSEEFAVSREDKIFCSRGCKQKHRQYKRYRECRIYRDKQIESAMNSYKNKKEDNV